MKILQCFTIADKQTGLFIMRAFQSFGHSVTVVDSKTEADKTVSVCESIKPDLILCSREEGLLEPVKYIRKKYPKIKIVCWNVDKRKNIYQFGSKLLSLFDSVHVLYTVALGDINAYRKECPHTIVKHLQQGCDLSTHKIEIPNKEDHKKYDCDVLFAGSISTVHIGRKNLIRFLMNKKDLNFKHFGSTRGSRIYDSEHNKACLCAKICLSNNGLAMLGVSMSFRVYKIMAAGGFLLEEYCPGIENWFKVGKEFDVYKNPQDCYNKIIYYLNNEEKRKTIAKEGYGIVTKNHTYAIRIKQIIDDIETIKL